MVNKKELKKHYNMWIKQISDDIKNNKCPQGIEKHIIKHATEDLTRHMHEEQPDWRRWSASMHNLLAIFDDIHLNGEAPSTNEKLLRLRQKYSSNRATHTPEPV